MKTRALLSVLAVLCVGAAAGGGAAKEAPKIELHKDMTLAQVQKLHPDMRHDVWLCSFTKKTGACMLMVGALGRGGRPRIVDLFIVAESAEIVLMGQANIRSVKIGMSKGSIRALLGEPTRTGSMGDGDSETEFWYYGDWVLHFKDGTLEKERGKPDMADMSPEEIMDNVAQSAIPIMKNAEEGHIDFVNRVRRLAPEEALLGEVWRTRERVFQCWEGELSRWGEPADNLLDELNGLNLTYKSAYMPERVPVTLMTVFPASTLEQREAIRQGKIMNGMSCLAVRASVGSPRDINRSIRGGRVVHSQWVYGGIDGTYLYFNDHKLDSWQD